MPKLVKRFDVISLEEVVQFLKFIYLSLLKLIMNGDKLPKYIPEEIN
jgi:hypothetical protein